MITQHKSSQLSKTVRENVAAGRVGSVSGSPKARLEIEDNVLQRIVIDRLADLGSEFPLRVHVQVVDGEVHLRGSVSSAYEHLTILLVVKSLNAVRNVHDRIVIGGPFSGNDLAEKERFSFVKDPRTLWGFAVTAVLLIIIGGWQWN